MKLILALLFLPLLVGAAGAQGSAETIYATERSFEKMAAEKGINAAFVEYLSPVGVMFMPDAVNGRETWKARPISPAALTWNPIWIDVSGNGAMAYSIGNSRYRPKGKDDTQVFYGHYITVWLKQPNGEFRAALDTGINHEKPASEPTEWKSPPDIGKETNPDKISAADSAVGFYQLAAESGAEKAYKSFLAEGAIVMREGRLPAFGKKAALSLLGGENRITFAKRKSFIEAVDLAYVYSSYTITDKKGTEVERGNFVQVWKLRGRKWLIAADVFVPLPTKKN
jgi:ketosteroid isomerase-like protein